MRVPEQELALTNAGLDELAMRPWQLSAVLLERILIAGKPASRCFCRLSSLLLQAKFSTRRRDYQCRCCCTVWLSMRKIILMIGTILMLWSSNAAARERLQGHCIADLRKLCPGVPPGDNALQACMREHIREVSFPCLMTLASFAMIRGSHKECGAHLRQCTGVGRSRGQFDACLRSAAASLSERVKMLLREPLLALANIPTNREQITEC